VPELEGRACCLLPHTPVAARPLVRNDAQKMLPAKGALLGTIPEVPPLKLITFE